MRWGLVRSIYTRRKKSLAMAFISIYALVLSIFILVSMFPSELEIKATTEFSTCASYLDIF
jgi:hypothetical protein